MSKFWFRFYSSRVAYGLFKASLKPLTSNTRTHDRLQQRLAKVVSTSSSQSDAHGVGGSSTVATIESAPIGISTTSLSANSSETVIRQCQTSLERNGLPEQASSSLSTAGQPQSSILQNIDGKCPSLPTRPQSQDNANNSSESLLLEKPEYKHESKPAARNCEKCDIYQTRLANLQDEYQMETHRLVEQVDALQAKLQYLTKDASLSRKKYVTESAPDTVERKLAEKDEKIYLLMEEGRTMAVTEQRHRNAIKKLKAELLSTEKFATIHQENYEHVQAKVKALQARVVRLDELEHAYIESQRQLSNARSELESLQSELASANATIADLRSQMETAMDETHAASSKTALETLKAEQQLNSELQSIISSLQAEKRLAIENANQQVAEFAQKADEAAKRARSAELQLSNELQAMEGRLEAMRALAEEASTGVVTDNHGKLLRQIETIQTQHAIALENWQGIEASLISRVRSLETEREDARQRESEMRRKAREMVRQPSTPAQLYSRPDLALTFNQAFRYKCLVDEVESVKDKASAELPLDELETLRARLKASENRAEAAEKELASARAESDKQQTVYKADRGDNFDRRLWLEEGPPATFKVPSRSESPLFSVPTKTHSSDRLLVQGVSSRTGRTYTPGSTVDVVNHALPSARRSSSQGPMRPLVSPISTGTTSVLMPSREVSRESQQRPASRGHQDELFDATDILSSSPQQITQDMVSVSTAGAGPSVQLVERMSAAIRRLEAEKVASREELSRVSGQRDEARMELAALMKEMETGKAALKKVSELEAELIETDSRYQTTLELLGEKSELVEELRADVQDVKAMYRELVERTTI